MILTSMIITILAPFKEIYRPQRHSRYGLLDILDGKSAYIAFIVLLCMYIAILIAETGIHVFTVYIIATIETATMHESPSIMTS